jgi:hypothetical protein
MMPLKKPITNKVNNDSLALGRLKVRQHRFKKPGFSFALQGIHPGERSNCHARPLSQQAGLAGPPGMLLDPDEPGLSLVG